LILLHWDEVVWDDSNRRGEERAGRGEGRERKGRVLRGRGERCEKVK
jgi:hypothetical protein